VSSHGPSTMQTPKRLFCSLPFLLNNGADCETEWREAFYWPMSCFG
jgi:hypothetical protein